MYRPPKLIFASPPGGQREMERNMPPFAEIALLLAALVALLSAIHLATTGAAIDRVMAAQDDAPAHDPEPDVIPDGFTRVWTTGHPSGVCDCLSVRRRGNETEHYRRIWFWQVRAYLAARWTVTSGLKFGGWYALNPVEWLLRLFGWVRQEAYGDFPIDPSMNHVEREIPVNSGHGMVGDADVKAAPGPSPLTGKEPSLRNGQAEVHLAPPIGLGAHVCAPEQVGRNRNAWSKAGANPPAVGADNAPLSCAFGKLDHTLATFGLIQARPGHSHSLALSGNRVLPHHQDCSRGRRDTGNGVPIQPAQIHTVHSPQVGAKATGFSALEQALADLQKAQEATALIRLISAAGSRDGLLGLALVAMAAAAPAAQAGPYVGADIQGTAPFYQDNLFTSEPQHFGGGDIHVGWRQGIFALEGGWYIGQGGSGDNRLSLSGFTVDGLIYSPVRLGGAEPFLTVGTANLLARSATITNSVTPDSWSRTVAPLFSEQNWDWRAGAGLEWGFTQSVRGRITARYDDFSFNGKMHGGATVSFGINVGM